MRVALAALSVTGIAEDWPFMRCCWMVRATGT
ncbi:hypothetical protein SAMN06296065_10899 [Novosphingobium panipatense]|uniref:Uncharacterized protein n=1 Tax=Novosphingobium panipatense TaxID=428991 RepID=A0ABY1QMJ7_9SPHN|nr:hypothetical protein SAMN06296065_10899 [Novosphingobium panipatense]